MLSIGKQTNNKSLPNEDRNYWHNNSHLGAGVVAQRVKPLAMPESQMGTDWSPCCFVFDTAPGRQQKVIQGFGPHYSCGTPDEVLSFQLLSGPDPNVTVIWESIHEISLSLLSFIISFQSSFK